MVGLNTAFGISVAPLFGGIGFTNANIAILGISVVFCGVIASMVSGILLKIFSKYLLMTRLCCFGTTILLFASLATFPTHRVWVVTINMIIGAIFLVPIIPVGIAFAAELTYPIDETVTNSFILMMSQLFGLIMANICIILAGKLPIYGISLLAISAGLAALCSMFIKEDLRRK